MAPTDNSPANLAPALQISLSYVPLYDKIRISIILLENRSNLVPEYPVILLVRTQYDSVKMGQL